jgi:DNA-binding MarR family transcriptional regulator
MSSVPSPIAPRIAGCTAFRLRKLTRRLTQHYDACLAPAGLRVTQYSLLSMLVHNPPLAMAELAQRMEMDRTTLTRNLQLLTAAGLVEAATGADARTRLVTVSGSGREAWGEARPLWRRAQNEVNAALGMEGVQDLHALLDASLERFAAAIPNANR